MGKVERRMGVQALRTAAIGATITTGVADALGDERYWVGYQNEVMVTFPGHGSFFHGDNWLDYRPATAGDIARFGRFTDGFPPTPTNGNVNRNPRTVFFGDWSLGSLTVPGGLATAAGMTLDDVFTFDFGTFGVSNGSGGGLRLTGGLSVGVFESGLSSLTLQNGRLQSPSIGIGSVGRGLGSPWAGLVADAHVIVGEKAEVELAGNYVEMVVGAGRGGLSGGLNAHQGTLRVEGGGRIFETPNPAAPSFGYWVGGSPRDGSRGVGRVEVVGEGSTLTTQGAFNLGPYGGTGALVVSDRATMTTGVMQVALADFGGGNLAGTGSVGVTGKAKLVATAMDIGRTGGSGRVDVTAAGILESGSISVGGIGTGALNVTGGLSKLTAGQLVVGAATGHTASVEVSTQAAMELSTLQLGTVNGTESYAGSAMVSGSGATIETADVSVGSKGGAGELAVMFGGVVTAQRTNVGRVLGSAPLGAGSLLVNGSASKMQSVDLQVGAKGTARVESGGKLAGFGAAVFEDGKLFVSGAGSSATFESDLVVAGAGEVRVDGGSLVEAGFVSVGYAAGQGGTMSVTGQGSMLRATASAITVGRDGHGNMEVKAGGNARSSRARVGAFPQSSGTVTISGEGSGWTVEQDAILGGTFDGTAGGSALVDLGAATRMHVGTRLVTHDAAELDVRDGGLVTVGEVARPSGEATPAGVVEVWTGGVLGGTGLIDGNVVLRGGQVIPGHSPGTLTITGDFQAGIGSLLVMEIGASRSDRLVVGGRATFAGPDLLLTFVDGFVPERGAMLELVAATDGMTGGLGSVTVLGLPEDTAVNLVVSGNGLTLSVVPEPGTLPLLASAGALMVRRNRHWGVKRGHK